MLFFRKRERERESVCVCERERERESFVQERVHILETERNTIISFLAAQLGSTAPGASIHNGQT